MSQVKTWLTLIVLTAFFVIMSTQVAAITLWSNSTSGNGTNSTSPGNATNATSLISTTEAIQAGKFADA